MHTNKRLKVAIVHDWLTNFAGSEQVILALLEIFPEAPIYTSVFKSEKLPKIFKKIKVYTSELQKLSFLKHQLLFPLMGRAFEKFDLSDYDIVITSSHASSKGVITKPETLNICYCHTPTRYLWSHYHEYLDQMEFGPLNPLIKLSMPKIAYKLRIWDRLAAERVDCWIANSENVSKRISKYYRKKSAIIYPPVNTNSFKYSENKKDYYIVCSRLIPYKKIELVIEAFNENKKPLKIIGSGSMEKELKKQAKSNIEFTGRVSDEKLITYYSEAKALIFPTEEDFGIVPVEAMASGTPVIAYNKGGAKETVIPKITGILFEKQKKESLMGAIEEFEKNNFDPQKIREFAKNFDKEIFKSKIKNFINDKLRENERFN